jgi:hypothetical protein
MDEKSISQFLTETLSSNRMIRWEISSHLILAINSKREILLTLDPVNNEVVVDGGSMFIPSGPLFRKVYWQAAQALDPVYLRDLSRDLLLAYSRKGDKGHFASLRAMDQASLHILLEKCL